MYKRFENRARKKVFLAPHYWRFSSPFLIWGRLDIHLNNLDLHTCSLHLCWQPARFNWFPWLFPSHSFYFLYKLYCWRECQILICLLAVYLFFSTADNLHMSMHHIKDWYLACTSPLSSSCAVMCCSMYCMVHTGSELDQVIRCV